MRLHQVGDVCVAKDVITASYWTPNGWCIDLAAITPGTKLVIQDIYMNPVIINQGYVEVNVWGKKYHIHIGDGHWSLTTIFEKLDVL